MPDRYLIDFPWGGERLRLCSDRNNVPFDSWEMAQRQLTVMRAEVDAGKFDPKNYVKRELKPLQFGNYVEAWIERREQDRERGYISRSYLREIKAYFQRYYLPFFGRMSIRDIRKRHIEDFLRQLPQHLSSKTVRNILGVFHKILSDAHWREDIAKVPLFPKIPKREPVTRALTVEEQEAILTHVRMPVYRAFFIFCMETGVRTGEARALRWENVDLKNNLVIIAGGFDLGVYKPYTKENDVRYLPLTAKAQTALRGLVRSLDGWVFVNSRGKPLSQRRINTVWQKAAQKAGLKISCYEGTRHSFASQAISRGVSERMVGDFLGHKTSSSTRRYAKMHADALRKVLADFHQDDCHQSVTRGEISKSSD